MIFYPADGGSLAAGPDNVSIPRKDKRDKTILVPSNNQAFVESVRQVFDLYVRVGLSRRQISARLNQQGCRFYSKEWSHTYVTQVLTNPAYAGDTHFGKTLTGKYHSFDGTGMVEPRKRRTDHRTVKRSTAERIIKENTHTPLIDRNIWRQAQEKLASEQDRTSFAPRNPSYYLKQLFVCGHCGKGLTARTEINPATKHRTVVYLCSTYTKGRCGGHPVTCGYQRITHDDAERLLKEKMAELDLRFDKPAPSEAARLNFQSRLARLGHDDDASQEQWHDWVSEGIAALTQYLAESYSPDYPAFSKLRMRACQFYWGDEMADHSFARLPVNLAQFKQAVKDMETVAVGQAKTTLSDLREEHAAYTKSWAKATDRQQSVLRIEIDRLEAEIAIWEPRIMPLTERLEELYAAEAARRADRDKLLADWPTLESREKGEALRRLFNTVTLFWERTHHPASSAPARPRKTDRPGRYSYALQKDQIQWSFANCDLGGSS